MTKKEFSKTVKIYKFHLLKNGFISINYCTIISSNSCTVQETVCIEKKGGALNSLYLHKI